MSEKIYIDVRYGLDPRAAQALMKLGIMPGSIEASSEGPLRWKFTFTFSCDRELAKYHVSTFLSDEYNATNVLFYASASNSRRCYCHFTPRWEHAIDAQEIKTRDRRDDRQRKTGDHTSGSSR